MNVSSYDVSLSDLRFDFHYVLIYNIAIRQLVTGKTFTQSIILHRPMIIRFWVVKWFWSIFKDFLFSAIIPFVIIASMNVQTFVIIHRRQRLSPRLHNRRSQIINDQAARQSYILLAILGVYLTCHIPSFILGKRK